MCLGWVMGNRLEQVRSQEPIIKVKGAVRIRVQDQEY